MTIQLALKRFRIQIAPGTVTGWDTLWETPWQCTCLLLQYVVLWFWPLWFGVRKKYYLVEAKWLRSSNLESLSKQHLIIPGNVQILRNQWLDCCHCSFQSWVCLALLLFVQGPSCFYTFFLETQAQSSIALKNGRGLMKHLRVFSGDKSVAYLLSN